MNKNRIFQFKPSLTSKNHKEQAPKQVKFDWIEEIKSNFHQKIEKPIEQYQFNMKNASQQRCYAHSIPYSLYCQLCRKLLCASCMYKNSEHRKHHVIPIQKSSEQIKQDIKMHENKIKKIQNQFSSISETNSNSLYMIDAEYTKIKLELAQFYQNLIDYIKNTQKQQLILLKERHQSMVTEIRAFERQISMIYHYISSKCKTYSVNNLKQELMGSAKIILQTLLACPNVIKDIDNENVKTKFDVDLPMLGVYMNDIVFRLDKIVPLFQNNFKIRKVSKSPKSASSRTQSGKPFFQKPRKKNLSTLAQNSPDSFASNRNSPRRL